MYYTMKVVSYMYIIVMHRVCATLGGIIIHLAIFLCSMTNTGPELDLHNPCTISLLSKQSSQS